MHQLLMNNCDKYTAHARTIHIAWTHIPTKTSEWENIMKMGFAACSNSHLLNYTFVKLIILNTEACSDAQMGKDDYKALILHELGHLLNSPDFEPELPLNYSSPDSLKHSMALLEKIRLVNFQNDEVYADYYAKRFGFDAALINTFHMHHLRYNDYVCHHDLRIEKINGSEVFDGIVRLIDRANF